MRLKKKKKISINQTQNPAVLLYAMKINKTGFFFETSAHLPAVQTPYWMRRLTLLYPPGEESIMSMLEAALRIWPLQIACGM